MTSIGLKRQRLLPGRTRLPSPETGSGSDSDSPLGRLSIARALGITLLGITLGLVAIAGAGLVSLYQARQRYEDRTARADAIEVANSALLAAGIGQEAQFRAVVAGRRPQALDVAVAAYAAAATRTSGLVRGDPPSQRLLAEEIRAQRAARLLAVGLADRPGGAGAAGLRVRLAGELQRARVASAGLAARQEVRRAAARATATSESRRALIAIILSAAIAVALVFVVLGGLIRSMRRPLDQLVRAAGRLAGGDLGARVDPDGPQELEALGVAFNRMGGDLAGATAALEDERHRLAVTIESLGDGLVICDADGRVEATNPRAGELVGELRPGGRAVFPGGPLPRLDEALANEVTVERDDGSTLAVTAAWLGGGRGAGGGGGGGGGGGVIWTVRDISERARLERAKSDFVATASHELRSPLTSIKGYVELLGSTGGLDARQRKFVRVIQLSADRLADLVNDLLDVAKIDADHVQLRRRPTALSDIVEEVAELMAPRLEDKHQTLSIDISGPVPLADVDPARIRQILTNLVTNAHLYTPENGSLRIGVANGEGGVRLAVSDTGRGMSPTEVEHVFERFYRAEGSKGQQGTGLGLAIVKSLVDLHDGSIEIASEPGAGTTFTVRLPVARSGPPPAAPAAIRGRRVLVVDDEPRIAELIAEKLGAVGVETETVNSGGDALRRLRAERFDAVTLDVLMPGMSGIDTLRAIRADPRLRATPVVFVSVFFDRGALAGEWVVPKPIDSVELSSVLARALESGRTNVLVVARPTLRNQLAPALEGAGVGYRWEADAPAAGRACSDERFELALVDAGMPGLEQVMRVIDLRGRRHGLSVIFVADQFEASPGPLGVAVLPIEAAVDSVRATLVDGGSMPYTATGGR